MLTLSTRCLSYTGFAFQDCFPSRGGFTLINTQSSRVLRLNAKQANLSASRRESIQFPTYEDVGDSKKYHISQFLSHPSGFEAVLNTRALQSYQLIEDNTYRCALPPIQLLNFEATPVMDMRMTLTDRDCTVEMLSCKFQGTEIMEKQNNHFSAIMTNHVRWDPNDSGKLVEVDVKLSVTLEIFTPPFVFLPVSAVEVPGNAVMQALVDRLVPLLTEQLLQDYEEWVRQQFGRP